MRDGKGFLLSEGAHHAEEHLVAHNSGIDPFLFKGHRHPQVFQLPHRFDAVLGIPGKPGHRFDQDAVDLSGPAVPHQAEEFLPFICPGAGDALVGVNVHKLPVLVGLDELGVVLHLGGKGISLVCGIAADPRVGGHSQLVCGLDRDRLNHPNLRHFPFPLFL